MTRTLLHTLVDALLALALLRSSSPAATPVAAMAAAGAGVAQRVQRLLFPPTPTHARVGLSLVLGAVLLGPILPAGMTVIVPMLCAS
ncbi:MAG: hypothetical protein M3Z25_05265 [Actinomycetota bacterium]|nr:hypothetical protein [Actinomycetota bacterium]